MKKKKQIIISFRTKPIILNIPSINPKDYKKCKKKK